MSVLSLDFSVGLWLDCPCQRRWRHAKYHRKLYYGNISPTDRDIVKGGSYSHILNLVTRNEDELMQTLTQAQQETFEKFKDCASELSDKNEMMSFVLGFKLGMRLAVETMISMDDITEPKMT